MGICAKIIGTGTGLPKTVMHNHEFETFVETSDEWIRTRTGIEERRIANPALGETTLTLALDAAKKALLMAKITPEELDLIVVGTVTPENIMPTTANQLQAILGAHNAFSFDMQAACAGSLYGLSIADQYIRSGTVKNALVIGVETLSSIVNWRDRGTCILFGDGAGALVLTASHNDQGIIDIKLGSDGRHGKDLCIPHGYCKVPPHSPEYRLSQHKVFMNGGEIFKMAVRKMVDTSVELLDKNNFKKEDVDFFIFHQANLRIIEMCCKALDVKREQTWINIQKYGNISAATLAVCLDEAWKAGAVKEGQLILMSTFGGGTTWGSALIRL